MKENIFNFNSLNKCRKFQLLNNGYFKFWLYCSTTIDIPSKHIRLFLEGLARTIPAIRQSQLVYVKSAKKSSFLSLSQSTAITPVPNQEHRLIAKGILYSSQLWLEVYILKSILIYVAKTYNLFSVNWPESTLKGTNVEQPYT